MLSDHDPSIAALPYYGRNIAFGGLTAAGKTTHCRLLSRYLGYKYVSATEIILAILGLKQSTPEGPWAKAEIYEHIQAIRQENWLDDQLEETLIGLAAAESHTVFDTWALPWISKEPLIRLWVESDRLSRTLKCMVSDRDKGLDLEGAIRLVDLKDSDTRAIFTRRHGFDLFKDHDKFDIILDNSSLIKCPTVDATEYGTSEFEPYVRLAVLAGLGHPDAHNELLAMPRSDEIIIRSRGS